MQTFPTEEVKVRACKLQCMEDRVIPDALEADHLEGYCVCCPAGKW